MRRLKHDDESISSSELMNVLNQIKKLCNDHKIIDLIIASVKSLMERDLPFKEKLTDRESEITLMISKGYPNDIIAQRLNLSKSTVETHRKNIRKKLKLKGNDSLFAFALVFSLQSNYHH